MRKILVHSKEQKAHLYEQDRLLKSYIISTASNGLGCENNSFKTPTGILKVSQKIGEDQPMGMIFKARVPIGEIWTAESLRSTNEDLILTRILWLEGCEEANRNTLGRYIYLHGTNDEKRLGLPVSHGCIRFSNEDIIEVFNLLDVGSIVIVD